MKQGLLGWGLALVLATASDAGARVQEMHCLPALKFYCGNIHIGCAGRTRIRTEPFTATPEQVTFQDGEIWSVRDRPDRGGVVLHRRQSRDWVRIEADGVFSLRRYTRGRAMMTRGRCDQVPDATR